MRGFGRLKTDYIDRSQRRIYQLGSEIERVEQQLSLIEKREQRKECGELLDDLKKGTLELEASIGEMGSDQSESWDWTLEIEDTESLFDTLSRRVRMAKEIIEDKSNLNSLEKLANQSKQ